MALQLYTYLIVALAILSWLVAFNVVNTRNNFVRSIWNFLDAVTEPALAADPQHPAESRRGRHLADHPDPLIIFIQN